MSGRYLLDTNAVIALLRGHSELLQLLQNAEWVAISVIVELEFLSFPDLPASDKTLFNKFKSRVQVISVDADDSALLEEIIRIRQSFNIKLPDAIISASTFQQKATLVSNDSIFRRVTDLDLHEF
jgi:tRNA(fMet)-specific endonuclease VapC